MSAESKRLIARQLKDRNRVLVLSHERPDGDAVGSTLALAMALRSMGIDADVMSSDPTPSEYRSLPGAETILHADRANGTYDDVVILECNGPDRTGIEGLDSYSLINIDHHTSALSYGRLNWIDTSFGAVGQMVFRLIEEMGIPISAPIATNLYTALVTDTGGFQFGNTTEVELYDAGRLVELGANPSRIAEDIYRSHSPGRVRLLGAVLSTMETCESDRIAWVSMSADLRCRVGAAPGDTEGIINHLMSIGTVVVAAFFKEESENSYKLSLRSKGNLDVSQIAQSYGGGGHKNAAGFTIQGSLDQVKDGVLKRLRRLVLGSSS